jgi:hypothetical protein
MFLMVSKCSLPGEVRLPASLVPRLFPEGRGRARFQIFIELKTDPKRKISWTVSLHIKWPLHVIPDVKNRLLRYWYIDISIIIVFFTNTDYSILKFSIYRNIDIFWCYRYDTFTFVYLNIISSFFKRWLELFQKDKDSQCFGPAVIGIKKLINNSWRKHKEKS